MVDLFLFSLLFCFYFYFLDLGLRISMMSQTVTNHVSQKDIEGSRIMILYNIYLYILTLR